MSVKGPSNVHQPDIDVKIPWYLEALNMLFNTSSYLPGSHCPEVDKNHFLVYIYRFITYVYITMKIDLIYVCIDHIVYIVVTFF